MPRALIRATPRIGVDYAGPGWAAKPWRFFYDPAALAVRPAISQRRRVCAVSRVREDRVGMERGYCADA